MWEVVGDGRGPVSVNVRSVTDQEPVGVGSVTRPYRPPLGESRAVGEVECKITRVSLPTFVHSPQNVPVLDWSRDRPSF